MISFLIYFQLGVAFPLVALDKMFIWTLLQWLTVQITYPDFSGKTCLIKSNPKTRTYPVLVEATIEFGILEKETLSVEIQDKDVTLPLQSPLANGEADSELDRSKTSNSPENMWK